MSGSFDEASIAESPDKDRNRGKLKTKSSLMGSSSHGVKVNSDAKLMPMKKTNFETFTMEESVKISNAIVM